MCEIYYVHVAGKSSHVILELNFECEPRVVVLLVAEWKSSNSLRWIDIDENVSSAEQSVEF